jgi:LysR family cyn operon transcriptional activator
MLLRHARYLVAIADQAISRAARRCMSQPTLSEQIRQLEDTLRAPLLDRLGPLCVPKTKSERIDDEVHPR